MFGSISSETFVTDSVLYLRDYLIGVITDPISGTRPGDSKFIMTSFPQRKVVYPLITIKDNGAATIRRLGMQSESSWMNMPIEVRVWARNVVERDQLSQSIHNNLQTGQFGAGSETTNFGLHDFRLNSMLNIDDIDENGAQTGIKTKQLIFNWKAII